MDIIIGNSIFLFLITSWEANNADFICKTSWHVSINKRSIPPSIRPLICSSYESFSLSKLIWTNVGNFVVGPIDPATNLGVLIEEYKFAHFFAIWAAFLLIS